MSKHKQKSLLFDPRFRPFFWTQFLGAFNDNLYKNALLIIIAFSSSQLIASQAQNLVNLATALFILPFFLFSALAGQLADKLPKFKLIRMIKLIEIAIMLLGSLAILMNWLPLQLFALFLLGTQSAFFGPCKYAMLPQYLKHEELTQANALVELGTFSAILLGTIVGGLSISAPSGTFIASTLILLMAGLGYWQSRGILQLPAVDQTLSIQWNPWKNSIKVLQVAYQKQSIWLSILAISWFWLLGSSYLTHFAIYADTILETSPHAVTLMLGLFTFGIGLGSMLCDKASGKHIEIGLVPIGAFGLLYFGLDWVYASHSFQAGDQETLKNFLSQKGSLRILFDLIMIGVSGGIYIVPLYSWIQANAEPKHVAQTIAANNIINALFMVVGALIAITCLSLLHLGLMQYFLVLSCLHLIIALYIFCKLPIYATRCLTWVVTHIFYRVKTKGLEHIPNKGGALVVCNHVGYFDAFFLAASIRRPLRFVMYKPIFSIPILGLFFKTAKAIPIDSKRTNPEVYQQAFDAIADALEQGELVFIFPEGKLTPDGKLSPFQKGVEKIIGRTETSVIPMTLKGLWGGWSSRSGRGAFLKLPKGIRPLVEVKAGQPIPSPEITAEKLQAHIQNMLDQS